jgi:hypothetical protein
MTFPVRYGVGGGRPRIDLSVTVAADGTAEFDILSEESLPQSPPLRLGSFVGQIDAATTASLAGWASKAGLLPDDAVLPPGSVNRTVSLAEGPSRTLRPEAVNDALEATLAAAATAALAHPAAAVEISAERAGELRIRSIGERPFRLVLFDGATAGYWVRVWRYDPQAVDGRSWLGYESVAALVDSGHIPEGVVELTSSTAVVLPLPPGSADTGGFMFWRAGTGPERRLITGSWTISDQR